MPDYAYYRSLNSENPIAIERKRIENATPAQGFGAIALTVPGEEHWHPLAIRATYTTSATAGNRVPSLAYDYGGVQSVALPSSISVPASTTAVYQWLFGWPTVTSNGTASPQIANPLPDIVLSPGWRIITSVGGFQVGDAWSNLSLLLDVITTVPGGPPPERVATYNAEDELALLAERGHPLAPL